jgi:type I restriction enzyme S subunit
MTSWPTVQLKEVATIERNSIAPEEIPDGTTYVGLEHIEAGGKILEPGVVTNGELASNKFRFHQHHVLYGKLRPYLAKIAMPTFAGVCSTDILPILPGQKLDKSYLTHFLRQPSMVDYATSRSEGANLPRLGPKTLADFQILLPPLDEQKRMAAILDQADELRRLRRRAIDRFKELGQAIFSDMFGDPASHTVRYPTPLLQSIAELINGDRSSNYPSGDDLVEEGILFLSTKNIENGEIDLL